jgi:GT2 family glycosyltransferase
MSSSASPLFTVIILTRNYGRYIRQAIDSVLQQTCSSWELFICDDASSDDTQTVLEPYRANPRIQYLRHETNIGQSANWASALDLGSAPIVGILHADDYWLPEALQTARDEFAADSEIDIVYGNWLVSREKINPLKPARQVFNELFTGLQAFKHQITRNLWLPSAMFVRRTLIKTVGKPRPDLRVHVDLEYHLRLAASARYVRAIPKAFTVYRVHEQSVTTRSARDGDLLREMQEFPDIIAQWARARPELAGELPTLRRIAAEGVLSVGITASTNGDRDEGEKLMRRAGEICGQVRLTPKAIIDRVLLSGGSPGYWLFRYLHRDRLNA